MCDKPEFAVGDPKSIADHPSTGGHSQLIDWQSLTLPGRRAKDFGRRYELTLRRFAGGTLLLEIHYHGDGIYQTDTWECECMSEVAETVRSFNPCRNLYRPDIDQLQEKFDKIEEHVERRFRRFTRGFLKECRRTLRVFYRN